MATPLKDLPRELERRIAVRLKKFEPDSRQMREALTRIGIMIEGQAKINVRKHTMIDSGRLINSIRYELFKSPGQAGVRVGPFGIPYAAMHEFGGVMTDRQRRAMFASLRERGKLGKTRQAKGVIVGGRFRERPYLRPAVLKHRARIVDIIRGLLASK